MDKSIEYYRWLEYELVWLFTHLRIFRGIHEVFCNTWPNDTSTETMLWSLEAPSVLPGGHGFPMDLPEKVPAILRALAVSNGRLSAWLGKLRCSKVKFTFQTDTSSQKYEVGQVNRVALMLKILSSRRFWVCSRDFPPSFLPAPISIPSMPMGFPQDFPPYFALGSFQKNALSLGVPEEHRADQWFGDHQ